MPAKFYAVVRGRKPGLYTSWADCVFQVGGYKNNLYKGFNTKEDALKYLAKNEDHFSPLHKSLTSMKSTGRQGRAILKRGSFGGSSITRDTTAQALGSKRLYADFPAFGRSEPLLQKKRRSTLSVHAEPTKSCVFDETYTAGANMPKKHVARSSSLWPAEQYRAGQQTNSTKDKPIGIVSSKEIARELLHKGYVEDARPPKMIPNNKILVNERKRGGPKRSTFEMDPGIVDVSNDGADVVDLTTTDSAGADTAVQPTCIGRKKPKRCKKCGATDHTRCTKNRCPMYEPRVQRAAPAVTTNVNGGCAEVKAPSLPDSLRMEEFTHLASESALFKKEHCPLDPYQEDALQMVMQGKNVFITGAAGTGKSTLLRRIQEELFAADKEFHVMAPTGIAAVNVGGCTINSFVGIGVPKTVHDFQKMWKKKKQLRSSDVWIIDEVSMLSGEILDFIESMMRDIRGSSQPFGGVQLILCGDFLQLPPVGNTPHPAEYKNALQATDLFLNRGYAFQATCWSKSQIHTARLQQVHRQGGDRHMVEALQEMRLGKIQGMARQFIRDCCRPLQVNTDGIEPTTLHCKNVDVDKINTKELERLTGDKHGLVKCHANDTTKPVQNAALQRLDLQLLEKYFGQCRALEVLSLKVGAQVMLLKNLSPSLVNGSRGVVTGFETWKKVYSRLNKEHKKNNSKSLLRTKGGDPDSSLHGEERVLEMINIVRGLKTQKGAYVYPIVKFQNGEHLTMTPETFSSQIHGIGESTRIQIPLTLAWAITVHKSQGMSIDHLIVSLGDVFTEGQAYVALSRATSKAGLEIRNFNPQCVFASQKCLAFEKGETTPSWLEEAQGTWDATRARVLEDLKKQASRVYPMCKCDQQASRMQVRKAGPNQDRFFFSCAKNYKHKDRCSFFQWDK